MSIHRLPGSAPGEQRRAISFDFYNQWSGILGRCKWYDFTLVNIEGEFSPYKGSVEFSLALLGFRVMVTYTYDWSFTDKMMSMKDEIVERLKAETGANEVRDPLGMLPGDDAYDKIMAGVDVLMREDPQADSRRGKLLGALATAIEEYERGEGDVRQHSPASTTH